MNISPEDISSLLEAANLEVITQDRKEYDPYFEVFERYAIKKGLVYTLLSAAYAINSNAGNESYSRPRYDSYMITCSSKSPWKDAMNVANELFFLETKDKKIVTILFRNGDYEINLNTRTCFRISPCQNYRGSSVDDIIGTSDGLGLWTRKGVRCQNVYSLVAYLLSQSYDPNGRVSEEVIKDTIQNIKYDIKKRGSGPEKKIRKNRESILKYINERQGIYLIHNGRVNSYLLDSQFSSLRQELENQFSIRVAAYNLHDIDDFALMKYIIHDSDDRPVCIFFNSLEHQVVPMILNTDSNPENKDKNQKDQKNIRVCRRYAARIKLLEIQMFLLMKVIGKDMTGAIKELLDDFFEILDSDKFYDEDDIVGYSGKCINWNVLKKTTGKIRGLRSYYPDEKNGFILDE